MLDAIEMTTTVQFVVMMTVATAAYISQQVVP